MPDRVVFTPAAVALVRSVRAARGPLIFHLSGGCCEGSAPMCLRGSDFRPGAQDVLLGEVEGCPFYVGAAQYDYWAPYRIVVDVTEGGSDSFSLEAADGVRFVVLSQRLTEIAKLAKIENGGRGRASMTEYSPTFPFVAAQAKGDWPVKAAWMARENGYAPRIGAPFALAAVSLRV